MKCLISAVFALALWMVTSVSVAVTVGQPAPPIALPTLQTQQTLSLRDLRGKVVLVDFWSSWCASCRQSLPYFDTLRTQLQGEAFEIFAVNLDDEASEALEFLNAYPVSYPIVWDEAQASPEAYGITRMPTSFLIDQTGVVRAIYVEFKKSDIADFEQDIRRLLTQ